MLFIEYDGGKRECCERGEIAAALNLRNENNENEFWIHFGAKNPCIAVLVKDDIAQVHYFSEEGDTGSLAVNNGGIVSENEICICIGGNEYYIYSENMIPFDDVVRAVLMFYGNSARPGNLTWEEL